jgi:Immunity protein 74
MFSLPRANVIESDAGFSVEVLGRVGMKYREGEKVLFVDSEVLAPGKGIALFTDSIREWEAPNGQLIGPEKKTSIIENIKAAFDFRGEPLEVL